MEGVHDFSHISCQVKQPPSAIFKAFGQQYLPKNVGLNFHTQFRIFTLQVPEHLKGERDPATRWWGEAPIESIIMLTFTSTGVELKPNTWVSRCRVTLMLYYVRSPLLGLDLRTPFLVWHFGDSQRLGPLWTSNPLCPASLNQWMAMAKVKAKRPTINSTKSCKLGQWTSTSSFPFFRSVDSILSSAFGFRHLFRFSILAVSFGLGISEACAACKHEDLNLQPIFNYYYYYYCIFVEECV